MTDATANQNKVDFVYFYGATNLATLASPSDTDAQTIFTAIADWTTINATKLGATTLTATEFDAIDDDAEIVIAATGLTATKANTLEVGDVIAFETASTSANASKKGLLKVVAITPENTGTITIAVKVQQ
jgi:predicted transcriptional regulator